LTGTNAWVAARAFVLFGGLGPASLWHAAHRLDEGLLECCERLGLSAEVFTTPTTIIMSFGAPGELSRAVV